MMGCFSGHLMSSASGQKLFCEVCSAFKCSFSEFVGEKVVSLSYSSAILALSFPQNLGCNVLIFIYLVVPGLSHRMQVVRLACGI